MANRTGITVGSVLVECEKIPDEELLYWTDEALNEPPCWAIRGEVAGPKDMICLPELLALIRRWTLEGKKDAVLDLTEMRLWT